MDRQTLPLDGFEHRIVNEEEENGEKFPQLFWLEAEGGGQKSEIEETEFIKGNGGKDS